MPMSKGGNQEVIILLSQLHARGVGRLHSYTCIAPPLCYK